MLTGLCCAWCDREVTYRVDPRVDDYIDALPAWQQQICRELGMPHADQIGPADFQALSWVRS
ncbi:hypothetical protein [Nocardia cyriacigeorgica]|uniref:hypothetical protein n=1 Tax=Nocardia cyriacigeorgica TaxID=135487 RepID=UPI001892EB32|nr:hypothetical protein [Nocardia cyriacigeorgica]MBF6415220.1 hypothetical protein [Nocardia cyriacigeorgica]